MTNNKQIPASRIFITANLVLLLLANMIIGYRIYAVYTLFPFWNLLLLCFILAVPVGVMIYVYRDSQKMSRREMLITGSAAVFCILLPLIFILNYYYRGPVKKVFITPWYSSQREFRNGELSLMRQFFSNGAGTRIDEHNSTHYFAFGCHRQLNFSIPGNRIRIDSIGFSYCDGFLLMPVFEKDTVCFTVENTR